MVDCREPRRLAEFYAELVGGDLSSENESWVVLTDPAGRRLAFQLSPEHEPPRFPDPSASQQFHLDILVEEIEAAETQVLALGATRVPDALGEDDFRVYRDPAGHTFCLVW
ncbi:MAG: VOC family protein [Mycobacterium sp.]